jgi:RNA polymerase primary sigma factor
MIYKKNNGESHFDIHEAFLKDVSKINFLSKEEEVNLIAKAKKGDKKSIDILVLSIIKYVNKIANSYVHKHLTSSDLIQEGVFGILNAINHFDAEKDVRFLTYATHWIKNAMNRACIDRGYEIRVPNNKYQMYMRFKKALKSSELDVAKLIYSSEFYSQRSDIISLMNIYDQRTTEGCYDEDGADKTIENLEVAETQSYEVTTYKNNKIIQIILDKLSEKERTVISLYYGINEKESMTLDQIGKKMKFTRERSRQIKNIAEEKIKLLFRKMKLEYSDL